VGLAIATPASTRKEVKKVLMETILAGFKKREYELTAIVVIGVSALNIVGLSVFLYYLTMITGHSMPTCSYTVNGNRPRGLECHDFQELRVSMYRARLVCQYC
jgi:hypothetical protein